MPLSINTNIASMTAQRSFINSNAALETAFERLSTGQRINSSVDDAAGLAIGTDLQSRVSGLNQAIRNVNDGISMVQIAEGALDEVTSILQKMRDLSVQASNASMGSTERGYIDSEQAKLSDSLDEALSQAKFNDISLFGTTAGDTTTLTLQDGADNNETVAITTNDLSSAILGVGAGDIGSTHASALFAGISDADVAAEQADGSTAFTIQFTYGASGAVTADSDDVTATITVNGNTAQDLVNGLNESTNTVVSRYTFALEANGDISMVADGAGTHDLTLVKIDGATDAMETTGTRTEAATDHGIDDIDAALATVASERANLGATQSQLESTVRNLANVAENTAAAASRIMDTDYAAETANLTKAQILQQAATSVLAQANAQPQAVLALLQ